MSKKRKSKKAKQGFDMNTLGKQFHSIRVDSRLAKLQVGYRDLCDDVKQLSFWRHPIKKSGLVFKLASINSLIKRLEKQNIKARKRQDIEALNKGEKTQDEE